jgi:hypothetical protein
MSAATIDRALRAMSRGQWGAAALALGGTAERAAGDSPPTSERNAATASAILPSAPAKFVPRHYWCQKANKPHICWVSAALTCSWETPGKGILRLHGGSRYYICGCIMPTVATSAELLKAVRHHRAAPDRRVADRRFDRSRRGQGSSAPARPRKLEDFVAADL